MIEGLVTVMKMVRVDDICNLCTLYFHGECTIGDIEDCECIVRSKIIDADPVKHGRWIETEYCDNHFQRIRICTNCKQEHGSDDVLGYCPNCGAKMDGE